jgi:hypothetical protein
MAFVPDAFPCRDYIETLSVRASDSEKPAALNRSRLFVPRKTHASRSLAA